MRAPRFAQWEHWPTVTLWGVWLLAPGSFALFTLGWWSTPPAERAGTNHCPAVVLAITHLAGGLYGFSVAATPGPHRKHFEFRALVAYVVVIVALIAIGRRQLLFDLPLDPVVVGLVLAANALTLSATCSILIRLARSLASRRR